MSTPRALTHVGKLGRNLLRQHTTFSTYKNRFPVQIIYTFSQSISTLTYSDVRTPKSPFFNKKHNSLTPNSSPHTQLIHRFSSTQNVVVVPVPSMGDSITEGTLNHWKKNVGDFVKADEVIAVIDTDKVSVDINSPHTGQITNLNSAADETVIVGNDLFSINTAAVNTAIESEPPKTSPKKIENVQQTQTETQKQTKKETPTPTPSQTPQKTESTPTPTPTPTPTHTTNSTFNREDTRTPMSRMRQRIGERLKASQNTACMLTTFNEVDMGPIMAFRSELKDGFQETHGVKMGFVSAFMLASTLSLKKFPVVNAQIDGKDIIYKNYIDIGVAVATPTGLMVPIVQNCQNKSWSDLEKNLDDLAKRARKSQIALEELSGGSFTISNGGVYGSMMSTPLLVSPQTSILGMHGIKKRAVVVNDEIVIRPMMYLALTYDHRLLDGREAVFFLNSIKNYIENPSQMLLGI